MGSKQVKCIQRQLKYGPSLNEKKNDKDKLSIDGIIGDNEYIHLQVFEYNTQHLIVV